MGLSKGRCGIQGGEGGGGEQGGVGHQPGVVGKVQRQKERGH